MNKYIFPLAVLLFLSSPLCINAQDNDYIANLDKKIETIVDSYKVDSEKRALFNEMLESHLLFELRAKLDSKNITIDNDEMDKLEAVFVKNLPQKLLSNKEINSILHEIRTTSRMYNFNGMLPNLKRLYGLDTFFGFDVEKVSDKKFKIVYHPTPYIKDTYSKLTVL